MSQARADFGAHDQASRLRAIISGEPEAPVRTSGPRGPLETARGPVIAITSGKGGVGKSSIGVNVCIAAAQRGIRTAMIDADLGMANADVLCGMMPSKRIEHAVESVGELDLDVFAVDAPGGFRLVPGSSGIARIADMGEHDLFRLARGARRLARTHQAVVVDTGAGLGPSVVALASTADAVLVVATPEPTSITDAYAMLKCLHKGGAAGVLSLLVNRVSGDREAHAVCEKISSVTDRFLGFRPLFAGWVPDDAAVGRAVRARRPFMIAEPASGASKAVAVIAERIQNAFVQPDRSELREGRSLFGRLSQWFDGNDRAVKAESAQFSAQGSRRICGLKSGITEPGHLASR